MTPGIRQQVHWKFWSLSIIEGGRHASEGLTTALVVLGASHQGSSGVTGWRRAHREERIGVHAPWHRSPTTPGASPLGASPHRRLAGGYLKSTIARKPRRIGC